MIAHVRVPLLYGGIQAKRLDKKKRSSEALDSMREAAKHNTPEFTLKNQKRK